VHHVRVLRSPRLNIELFEVTTPRQRPVWPDLLDIGGWALTAAVDDAERAGRFLAGRDVYDLGRGRYMTPWGLQFQLAELPNTEGAGPASAPDPGSLPGFHGFQGLHVTVADVDEASRFLEEVLGFECVDELAKWPPGVEPGELTAMANVDARADPGRARLLRSRHLDIQLVECPEYPGQNRVWPGMFDVGGWHLALYVDDMDAAYAELVSRDLYKNRDLFLLGRKKPAYMFEAGDEAYTLHGLAAFGLYFELVTYPHGRYREAEYAGPAWHPGRSSRQ
jgi:hypothetical protein